MRNWDDDDEEPNWKPAATIHAPVANSNWEGEDEEEGEAESWDSEKPAEKAADAPKVVPGARTLTKRQAAVKKEEEEKQARLKREEAAALALKNANDPEYQKLAKEQQKREEEEADLSLAMDAFGGNGIQLTNREVKNDQLDKDNVDMAGTKEVASLKKELENLKLANPMDSVELKTATDYKNFGEKSVDMAAKAGNQKFVVEFLNAAIDKGTKRMKLDDVAALHRKITAILTEKQKAEKPVKKTTAATKKGSLVSGKSALGHGNWDDQDQYYDDFAV